MRCELLNYPGLLQKEVKFLHLMSKPPLLFLWLEIQDFSFLILPSAFMTQNLFIPFFQHYHYYFLLPRSLHLFPGPGQWLVREPGPVFTLEREEEAELPQLRGRGVLRPLLWLSRSSPRSAGLWSLGFMCCLLWVKSLTKLGSQKSATIILLWFIEVLSQTAL